MYVYILYLCYTQAVMTLNSTEGLISSLDTILSDLNIRLDSLQSQIEQNILDLETAKNLTAIAEEVANETEVVNPFLCLYSYDN